MSVVNHFNVETERTKTVIAANHCTHRVLHPSVEEVAFALGQRLHKRPHGFPCRWTHSFRALTVDRNPLHTSADITGMLNGILVLFHQVGIDRLTNGGDTYLVHYNLLTRSATFCLVSSVFCSSILAVTEPMFSTFQ